MIGFGTLWMFLAFAFMGWLNWRTGIAIGAVALLLCFVTVHQSFEAAGMMNARSAPVATVSGRGFGLILALEWILILASVVIFRRMGRRDIILPTIALIVGLHFAPLANLFGAPLYYFTAGAITFTSLVSFLLPAPKRQATACLGCGIALWLTSAVLLIMPWTV
jgi:hypothetical protein